jgi:hypothetical protein
MGEPIGLGARWQRQGDRLAGDFAYCPKNVCWRPMSHGQESLSAVRKMT